MSFEVGSRVIHIISQERGVVVLVHPPARGRQVYTVQFGVNQVDVLQSNLVGDFDVTDPFVRMQSGFFGTRSDFSQINTSHKINNSSSNAISTLKASKTVFKAYQFKPLLKFLNSDNRRILIADEVGLGKTIEAGHIMLELRARGELKGNALIVCPNSLCHKWAEELRAKFNLNFKIYKNKAELLDDLKVRNGSFLGIVNYEKMQVRNDEPTEKSLFHLMKEQDIQFDFLLFDEAHRLRNPGTKLYMGAQLLMHRAKSAVMLTATPIMISEENLYYLLRLLDSDAYDEPTVFKNQLAVNEPLVRALRRLNSGEPLQRIAKDLPNESVRLHYSIGEDFVHVEELKIQEAFAGVELFNKVIQNLSQSPDIPKTRVQLQFDLTNLSELNSIFSRTRKREITTDWSQATRNPHLIRVPLNSDEQQRYDREIEKLESTDRTNVTKGQIFKLISVKRRLASSVYAYLNREDDLVNGIDRFSHLPDAKFDELMKVINEVCNRHGKKIIVFGIFRKTLEYLRIRLNAQSIYSEVIHGKIIDRNTALYRFKNEDDVKVLLSSEVGSEGLDLQFCDALVNYDLPWNPMVIEQRIGRIDRFGQRSPVVNIYNMVVTGSIQEQIYDRLLYRIGIFQRSIGDLEAILNAGMSDADGNNVGAIRTQIRNLERDFYSRALTEQERREKLQLIERAIIAEEVHLQEISEGLTDTMTNDVYFRNEIEQIKRSYKYVTEVELLYYLQELIRQALPSCMLECLDPVGMCYRLHWGVNQSGKIKQFLEQHRPNVDDQLFSFRQFYFKIEGESGYEFTLSQEFGYENPQWERVNAYHPLMVAATYFFKSRSAAVGTTFKLKLNVCHLKELEEFGPGTYFLGVYSLTFKKVKHNHEQVHDVLIPIVFHKETDRVIGDLVTCETFLGECQIHGEEVLETVHVDADVLAAVRADFAEQKGILEEQLLREERMKSDAHIEQKKRRINELYNIKIQHQENIVERTRARMVGMQGPNILPVQEAQLARLKAEREAKLLALQSSQIALDQANLLSLNLILVH